MVNAVIFDIDGTLLDTERIYIAAWKAAGAELGYTIPNELLIRTRGIGGPKSRQMMLDALGADFPYTQVQKRRIELAEAAIPEDGNLQKPGALALLQALQAKGIPFAAATSTGREHTQTHLAAAGLDTILTHRITGDMVKHGKPAPDIFLQAAALLGVAPESCLVVEDSQAGLAAGNAAGMKTVWIPDRNSNPNPGTADCWRQMDSLTALLEEIG